MITFCLPFPSKDMITSVSKILGNPFTASVIRMRISSKMPPKYPVNAPNKTPATVEKRTTDVLITSVVPNPCITLEKISLPKLSVPKI